MRVMMLIRATWNHLKHLKPLAPFEIDCKYSDHLTPFETICEHLRQFVHLGTDQQ